MAGDAKAAKIHVHNGRPDLVLRHALRLGRIVSATIIDLDHQADEVREAGGAASVPAAGLPAVVAATASPTVPGGHRPRPDGGHPPTRPAPWPGRSRRGGPFARAGDGAARVPLGIIAVVPGDGFAQALAAFGGRRTSGCTSRSSAAARRRTRAPGEILEAIVASPAEEVVILPNNPNVKLAAGQAAEMADRPMRVVPTRNAAEGLAALLEVDPGSARAATPSGCWRPGGPSRPCSSPRRSATPWSGAAR